MKRREFEEALRAAAHESGELEFVVIGSQAIHGSCHRPPVEALLSQECDIYPRNNPRAADLLNAKLGRGSQFARQHGFYVDIVSPEIASLAGGWEKRLRPIRIGKVTAHCLEIHDLLISKLAAGRLKDLEFAAALLKHGIAKPTMLLRRIRRYPSENEQQMLRERLAIVRRSLL